METNSDDAREDILMSTKIINYSEMQSLLRHGYCACLVSREDRQFFHPNIDAVIKLTDYDIIINGRLVADQEMPKGGVISIYQRA
jgi:hypothetical protein